MTPRLADLREPPIVGKRYMVPAVRYRLIGRVRWWPVLGPLHSDAKDLEFPHLHYHLDGRFMPEAALRAIAHPDRSDDVNLNAVVLTEPNNKEYWGPLFGDVPRRPSLRSFVCRRTDQPFTDVARVTIAKRLRNRDPLAERYGRIAEPIRRRDGRLLCPHRKVDLSQYEPDADGIVACPLHGLRVRCRPATPQQEVDAV